MLDLFRRARFSQRLCATSLAAVYLFTNVNVVHAQGQATGASLPQVPVIAKKPDSTPALLVYLKEQVQAKRQVVDQRMAEGGAWARIKEFTGVSSRELENTDDLGATLAALQSRHATELQQFDEVVTRLQAKGLSEKTAAKVWERVAAAKDAYLKGYNKLQQRMAAVRASESLSDEQAALDQLGDFLDGEKFERSHERFDPNAPLPFGSAEPLKPREPSKTLDPVSAMKSPFVLHTERLMGVVGDALIAPANAAFVPPGTADLGETPEVKLSPAIRAKAAELHNNSIEIYNWVRNNIEWVPSYGSMQDADSTLISLKGNDFAISSLLIALLRAANFSARYAYGVVEIPVDKAQNWVGGATSPNAALTLLGQAGIPARGIVEGGRIVSIEMEHVWVEAFVDFVPSRGVKNIQPDTWVSLDASFKQYEFEVVGTGLVKKSVVPFILPMMPSGLPYRLGATTAGYSAVPDALRHSYTVKLWRPVDEQVGGQPIATCSMATMVLSKKGMMLEFFAASADDATMIRDAVEGVANDISAYLVALKASLRVGDESCAYSTVELGMGDELILEITDQAPGYAPIKRRHALVAGESVAMGFAHDVTVETPGSAGAVQQTYGYARTEANRSLINALDAYFSSVFALNSIAAASKGAIYVPQPSFGLIRRVLNVEYLFGVPFKASEAGYTTDVLSLQHLFVSKDGDSQKALSLRRSGGPTASLLEAKVLEDIVVGQATPRITTVDVLKQAILDGANVMTVDRANMSVINQFAMTAEEKGELLANVQTGRTVMTPDRQISIGAWTGIGYVVEVPGTGAAAYKISGNLNGGYLDSRDAACPSPGKNAFLPIPMADPTAPVTDVDWIVRECVFEYRDFTIQRFRLYTETLEGLRTLIQTSKRAEMERLYGTTDSPTIKFVLHYYLGGGQDVHLDHWIGGVAATLEESTSVTSARALYLSNEVIPKLRAEPDGTPPSATYDVHLTFESGLFVLGDGRVTLSSQPCRPTGVGNTVYACQLSGVYQDYFRDPLDLGAIPTLVINLFSDRDIELNVELPGGTPYNIKHDWSFGAFAAVPQG